MKNETTIVHMAFAGGQDTHLRGEVKQINRKKKERMKK